MKELKGNCRLLKLLGETYRIRILNLLNNKDLNVAELLEVLGSTQSNISKHLAKLRMAGLVNDKREGQHVFYSLAIKNDQYNKELMEIILKKLSDNNLIKKDIEKLKKIKRGA